MSLRLRLGGPQKIDNPGMLLSNIYRKISAECVPKNQVSS